MLKHVRLLSLERKQISQSKENRMKTKLVKILQIAAIAYLTLTALAVATFLVAAFISFQS